MEKCIFCMINNKELPSKAVYEDDYVLAFDDIHPQAPVHVVVISKRHIKDIVELAAEAINDTANNTAGQNAADNKTLIGALMKACIKVAEIKGIKDSGFRIINNCGEDAGQSVMHVHFHVLGGESFGEKL